MSVIELEDVSTEYLQAEIDRRLKVELAPQKPEQLLLPGFEKLRKIYQDYIDALEKMGMLMRILTITFLKLQQRLFLVQMYGILLIVRKNK